MSTEKAVIVIQKSQSLGEEEFCSYISILRFIIKLIRIFNIIVSLLIYVHTGIYCDVKELFQLNNHILLNIVIRNVKPTVHLYAVLRNISVI